MRDLLTPLKQLSDSALDLQLLQLCHVLLSLASSRLAMNCFCVP